MKIISVTQKLSELLAFKLTDRAAAILTKMRVKVLQPAALVFP